MTRRAYCRAACPNITPERTLTMLWFFKPPTQHAKMAACNGYSFPATAHRSDSPIEPLRYETVMRICWKTKDQMTLNGRHCVSFPPQEELTWKPSTFEFRDIWQTKMYRWDSHQHFRKQFPQENVCLNKVSNTWVSVGQKIKWYVVCDKWTLQWFFVFTSAAITLISLLADSSSQMAKINKRWMVYG